MTEVIDVAGRHRRIGDQSWETVPRGVYDLAQRRHAERVTVALGGRALVLWLLYERVYRVFGPGGQIDAGPDARAVDGAVRAAFGRRGPETPGG